jgi:hypothetical protein
MNAQERRENGNNMANSGIWILRGLRRGSERGRCPLCLGRDDAKHILLKCPETRKCRESVSSKWLNVNEDIVYKIICCTNVTEIKTIGKYFFKTKCKRGGRKLGVEGTQPPLKLAGR